MKPLKLKLEAFGSFAGHEEVDFEKLIPRGLFVVSGDTGSGKTTIFDAMCWALYGRMPLKESDGVRSDHVGPERRMQVELTFECDGECYVVVRNPEQRRPSRQGDRLVIEPASAHLMRVHGAGTGTESLATGVTATSKACEELIGLDAEQFKRVILLPQGEFSRFLLASSSEREPLLSQLFGGQLFNDIVDQLKDELDDLHKELGATDLSIGSKLEDARKNLVRIAESLGDELLQIPADADRDQIETALTLVDGSLKDLRHEVNELDAAAKAADDANRTAEQARKRFEQAGQQREVLEELDADQPVVDAAARIAGASAIARPVVEAADELDSAEAKAAKAKDARDNVRAVIGDAFASIGVEADTLSVTSINDLLNEQQTVHDANREALQVVALADLALTDAQGACRDIDEKRLVANTALRDIGNKLGEINTALPEQQAKAVDTATITAVIDRIDGRIEARRRLDATQKALVAAADAASKAGEAYRRVLKDFVATQAPRLADTLIDGEPCPVCGAADHPRPASRDGDTPAQLADLERAATDQENANRKVHELGTDRAKFRAELGDDVDTILAVLEDQNADLRSQLESATEAAEEVSQLVHRREQLDKDRFESEKALVCFSAQWDHAAEEVSKCEIALRAAERAAEGIDSMQVDRAREVLNSITRHSRGLEEIFNAAGGAEATASAARKRLDSVLQESPFATVDSARDALVSLEQEEANREVVRKHHEARAEANTLLQNLEEQGIPEEPPDLEVTEARRSAAVAAHRTRNEALTTASDARRYAKEALDEHHQLVAGSGDLRDRTQLLEQTYMVCRNGGPGAAMSLKRWVLTRELDRVTTAANVHLQRMTGERYTLKRREESRDARRTFGLDLDVFDAQTGRPRSTRSLSGGEQFQASLALALGLADVVSHGGTGSGKSFEALFVDEGFGSLSAQSLDDAIETLHQLHATGRMVGAITHVEAMKQQLHVGIEVRAREDGRGSTLLVHP